jgi:hypothetical protein
MRKINTKNRQNNNELSDDEDPDYYNYNKYAERNIEQKNLKRYRDYKGSRQDTQNTHEDDEYMPENKNLIKKNSQINSNKIPSYSGYGKEKNEYYKNNQPERNDRRNTNNIPLNLPNSNMNNMNKNRSSNIQNSSNNMNSMPNDKPVTNQYKGDYRNNNNNEPKGQSNVVKSISLLLEELNFNELLYMKEKVDMKLFSMGNSRPNKPNNRNNENYSNSNDYYEDDY